MWLDAYAVRVNILVHILLILLFLPAEGSRDGGDEKRNREGERDQPCYNTIEEEFIQKRRQRSSLLLRGQKSFNYLPRKLFCTNKI